MEYDLLPNGKYVVAVDDCKGDVTEDKHKLKVTYRITDGDYKNRLIWKDYYISEKTCAKFLPWQFGILGIWKVVRDADNFEGGLFKAIDEMGEIMKSNQRFIVETTQEDWEYNGKTGTRVNAIVTDILVRDNLDAKPDTTRPDIDNSDELPF